ncbi:MAG: ABC transporter ATP-binding protein [Acidimicrobiia bacterium]|nr:ABC transporter ATP-binding protein [Acidimicrobiia bacterium]
MSLPITLPASVSVAAQPVIEVDDVHRTYGEGETAVHALRGVSFTVDVGDYVAIRGTSGSGKSTLMNILGCLDAPTSGRYVLEGHDVSRLDDSQQAVLRNRRIGFVFQSFNLLRRTSAIANVELPLVYAGLSRKDRRRRAMAALELVGLADRIHHLPNELSGGQQQRVAVARALVTSPSLVLADEPTGNLDSTSTEEVLVALDHLNVVGRTIVVITHEDLVAEHTKRTIELLDGMITGDHRTVAVGDAPPRWRGPS